MLAQLKDDIMEGSRRRKNEHFYSMCEPGMTVLDVGVHGGLDEEEPRTLNYFLNNFRYDDEYYTGLGIEDLSKVAKSHRNKKLVQYPGDIFPFKDDNFDFVFSSAVIEHVGDDAAQLQFLNEMLRVGKTVFFTTPNKYFPIETHTNVAFLHWADSAFYAWCKRYDPYYRRETLSLFSLGKMEALLRRSNAKSWNVFHNKFVGLTMTFTVVGHK